MQEDTRKVKQAEPPEKDVPVISKEKTRQESKSSGSQKKIRDSGLDDSETKASLNFSFWL